MLRAWISNGPWVAVLWAVATAALAQESPGTSSGSIPQVTIETQRKALSEEARQFVGKITGSSWAAADDDHPLELWRIPICPAVAGLQRPQGEFIYTRITQVVTAAGARVGKNGCVPNLIVVMTTQPEEFLRAWRKRDKRLFGGASPHLVKQFFDQALPVRVWYNTSVTGEDGDVGTGSGSLSSAGVAGGTGSGGMGESAGAVSSTQLQMMLDEIQTYRAPYGGTRLSLTEVPDLSSAIIVVDLKRCEGFSWGALADYIAMAALTNVDLHTDFGDMPSILALFGAPVDKREAGLTDWDRVYLSALYHTNRMSRLQRVQIREQMVREMDPARTGAR